MIKVFVMVRNIYGRDLIYPACPVSEIIASIAKSKTLSDNDIAAMKKLGYEIVVKGVTL